MSERQFYRAPLKFPPIKLRLYRPKFSKLNPMGKLGKLCSDTLSRVPFVNISVD